VVRYSEKEEGGGNKSRCTYWLNREYHVMKLLMRVSQPFAENVKVSVERVDYRLYSCSPYLPCTGGWSGDVRLSALGGDFPIHYTYSSLFSSPNSLFLVVYHRYPI